MTPRPPRPQNRMLPRFSKFSMGNWHLFGPPAVLGFQMAGICDGPLADPGDQRLGVWWVQVAYRDGSGVSICDFCSLYLGFLRERMSDRLAFVGYLFAFFCELMVLHG